MQHSGSLATAPPARACGSLHRRALPRTTVVDPIPCLAVSLCLCLSLCVSLSGAHCLCVSHSHCPATVDRRAWDASWDACFELASSFEDLEANGALSNSRRSLASSMLARPGVVLLRPLACASALNSLLRSCKVLISRGTTRPPARRARPRPPARAGIERGWAPPRRRGSAG